MRTAAVLILLLLSGVGQPRQGFGQSRQDRLPPERWVQPPEAGPFLHPDGLSWFKPLPDSLFDGAPLPPPNLKRLPLEARRSAMEAAEVDPEIVIFPDSSVNAHLRRITPPLHIDPKMILPPNNTPRQRRRH